MTLVLFIAGILLLSRFFRYMAVRLRIPDVVALIAAGLLLGLPFIADLLSPGEQSVVFTLGDAGFVALMFAAGFESSWKMLYREKRDAAIIASFAAAVPFTLGTVAFLLFGFPLTTAFVVGISMSITAEATKARVLYDLGKLDTRAGAAMIGAGIIDDTLGFALFLLTTFLLAGGAEGDYLVPGAIAAFVLGMALRSRGGSQTVRRSQWAVRLLNTGLVPFFFISMGMHFRFSSLAFDPWILAAVVVLAFAGKLGGTLLARPFTGFSLRQLYLMGWAMNSRGAVELALAMVALRRGVISTDIYSSIVIMALITTLSFPFVITRLVRRDPSIMD